MSERPLQTDSRQLMSLPELNNALDDSRKINMTKFGEPERKRIAQVVSTVGKLDSNTVITYGADRQRQMNSFLDELLQGIRTSDVGEAGALTLELARHIKAMRLPEMKSEIQKGDWVANTLGRLPLVGKYASALRAFQLNHAEITKYLKEIEDSAQRMIGTHLAGNTKLDKLVERTIMEISAFEIDLAAGQAILMRERAAFYERREALKDSHDPIALMRLRDDAEHINAFETRLLRMNIAYTESIVSVPEIRLTQEAARIDANEIMNTILFDLPALKKAILRVASLTNIERSQKETEARRELTKRIGTMGSDMLESAYVKAKESQGRGAEDVAMLAEVADKLLETINRGIQLDEENRHKRQAAERQLEATREKLVDGMRASAEQMAMRSV